MQEKLVSICFSKITYICAMVRKGLLQKKGENQDYFKFDIGYSELVKLCSERVISYLNCPRMYPWPGRSWIFMCIKPRVVLEKKIYISGFIYLFYFLSFANIFCYNSQPVPFDQIMF